MIMIFGISMLNYLQPTNFLGKPDWTVGALPSYAEKVIFANFLSKYKLLIQKDIFWGKSKKKYSISTTDIDTKKILAQTKIELFKWYKMTIGFLHCLKVFQWIKSKQIVFMFES